MTVTTPPHMPNRTATNTSETSTPDTATNRDRRAFMAGAAGAGATLAGLAAVSPVQAADMAMPKDLAGKTALVTRGGSWYWSCLCGCAGGPRRESGYTGCG